MAQHSRTRARKDKRIVRRKPARKPARKAPRAKPLEPRAVEAALAGIAHDIRTPLTGIVALAELLVSSDIGAREREWAEALKGGAEHLAALTTLIIDAAKADATGLVLRREPFSPRALTQSVAQALAARAGTKSVRAEIAIAPDLPPLVAGDALRLRAALENLADNAVKFTGEGAVSFSAALERKARGKPRLVFTVADSGIGMTAAELKRLFRPFAQASEQVARQYGGAGLGLSFVQRVAKAMGGDLAVTSKPGRGTTFRLSIPVDLVDKYEAPEAEAARAAGRSLAILCAEDNPYGRVILNTILRELGHRVDFVDDGDGAVRAAARGGYDAVLMDVTLPGLDGFAAAKAIRALPGDAAQVLIVGISGRSGTEHEAAARAAGMNAYLGKPVSPARLAQVLLGML
jgi:CheY-like chemotaxis protein/nitrogen-specific signal transduction histidine kinase